MAKDPELEHVVKYICDVYTDVGFHGIRTDTIDFMALQPAPPTGHPERRKLEPFDPELEPVCLVLSTVHRMGAALDLYTMTIYQRGEVTTPFLTMPYNHLLQRPSESHHPSSQPRSARTTHAQCQFGRGGHGSIQTCTCEASN